RVAVAARGADVHRAAVAVPPQAGRARPGAVPGVEDGLELHAVLGAEDAVGAEAQVGPRRRLRRALDAQPEDAQAVGRARGAVEDEAVDGRLGRPAVPRLLVAELPPVAGLDVEREAVDGGRRLRRRRGVGVLDRAGVGTRAARVVHGRVGILPGAAGGG